MTILEERTAQVTRFDPLKPRRRRATPVVTGAAIVIGVLSLALVLSILLNSKLQWPIITEYFFHPAILAGLGVTLAITALAMVIAIALGSLIVMLRVSGNWVLEAVAAGYVWFFRSVPALVLLLLVYNISILFPRLVVGIPFGPELFAVSTKDLVNGFVTGVAVFGLQQAAYTSEILRSAYLSVNGGQVEAAKALGMTPYLYLRKIIAPQAFRVALPPIANDTINLMKSTSLLAFIAVADLLYSAQLIYSRNYQIIPLLIVVCLWYVILVSALTVAQSLMERYLRTGSVRRSRGARPSRGSRLNARNLAKTARPEAGS